MDGSRITDGMEPGAGDPVTVARALASALDADDFDSVEAMLGDDVTYRIGDAVHHGPDAVVASYRNGSELAQRIFERVAYSHEVIGLVGQRTVRVDFADALHAGGETLDHHSVQDVEVGRDGRIISIIDQPVDGQQERVADFLTRHGLTRGGSSTS